MQNVQSVSNHLVRLAWTESWQLAVLAVVVGATVRLACRRRPHLAYLLWMLVIVKAVTPPLWSSPAGAFSWAAAETLSEASPVSELPDFEPRNRPLKSAEGRAKPAGAIASAAPVGTAPPARWELSWQLVLVGTWSVGCAGLIVLIAARRRTLARLLRATQRPVEPPVAARFEELRRRIGPRRGARLVVTSANLGPAAFGWWRGTVVVPEAVIRRSSADELAAILAHELVHLRRLDPLATSLQLVVQCAWWFHPAVWWANHRVRFERERCCDEEVLAELACPRADYARLLVEIIQWRRQLVPLAFWSGMRGWEVTAARLRHVLEAETLRRRTPAWGWLLLIAAACVALPGAALRRSAAQAPGEAPPVRSNREAGQYEDHRAAQATRAERDGLQSSRPEE